MSHLPESGRAVPAPRIPRITPVCASCPADDNTYRTWMPGETCEQCGKLNDGTGQLDFIGFARGDGVGAIGAIVSALHELKELLSWSPGFSRRDMEYSPADIKQIKANHQKVYMTASVALVHGFPEARDGLVFDVGDSPHDPTARTGRLLVGARDDVPNHVPPTLHRIAQWATFELGTRALIKSERNYTIREIEDAMNALESLARRRPWMRMKPFMASSVQRPPRSLPSDFDAWSVSDRLQFVVELVEAFLDTLESYGRTDNGDYSLRTENHAWQLRESWLARVIPSAMSTYLSLADHRSGRVSALRDRLKAMSCDRVFDVLMPEGAFLTSTADDLRSDLEYLRPWVRRLAGHSEDTTAEFVSDDKPAASSSCRTIERDDPVSAEPLIDQHATRDSQSLNATTECSISRCGSGWRINFRGREAVIDKCRGIEYLILLLGRPHEEVSALTLTRESTPAAGVHHTEILSSTKFDGFSTIGSSVLPQAHDLQALRNVEKRLECELSDACEYGNDERVAEITADLESVRSRRRADSGLGGHGRTHDSSSAKAGSAVRKGISRAYVKVRAVLPEFETHLLKSITLGTTCMYSPIEETTWTLQT